jgi:hypothetical protein
MSCNPGRGDQQRALGRGHRRAQLIGLGGDRLHVLPPIPVAMQEPKASSCACDLSTAASVTLSTLA